MNEEKEYQQDTLEMLRKSKEQVGYLRPCVVDQDGNYLSGEHRKQVDENWPEELRRVKDELEREVLKVHYNVQRRVPLEETTKSLLRIAQLLENRGVPTQDICSKMYDLLPFTDRYIRLVLPTKYKHDYEKSEILPNLHKDVKKRKFDRVKDSKRLAEHLKNNEKPHAPRPPRGAVLEETVKNPSLAFPDCRCAGCPHFEECRKLFW